MKSITRRMGAAKRTQEGSKRTPAGKSSSRPKLVAVLLLAGIIVIGGGSVYAATRPTWSPPAMKMAEGAGGPIASSASTTRVNMTTRTQRSRSGVKPSNTSHPAPASAPAPPITYTVKSGDTLSGIAQWFKLHGYGGLYRANMAVIGADPNLIFPGQRITIARGKMTMSSPARKDGSSR